MISQSLKKIHELTGINWKNIGQSIYLSLKGKNFFNKFNNPIDQPEIDDWMRGCVLSVFHQFQAKTELTDMQFKSKLMKF